MLNQCIFIGKINKITRFSKDLLVIQIVISNNDKNHGNLVAIDVNSSMIGKTYLREEQMIAIKARVESKDASNYRFQAERITLLGGQVDA